MVLCARDPDYKEFIRSSDSFIYPDEPFPPYRWSLNTCFKMLFDEEPALVSAGAVCMVAASDDGAYKSDQLPELALSLYLANELDPELDAMATYSEVSGRLGKHLNLDGLHIELAYLLDEV